MSQFLGHLGVTQFNISQCEVSYIQKSSLFPFSHLPKKLAEKIKTSLHILTTSGFGGPIEVSRDLPVGRDPVLGKQGNSPRWKKRNRSWHKLTLKLH